MKTQTLQGLESLGVRGGVYTSPGSTIKYKLQIVSDLSYLPQFGVLCKQWCLGSGKIEKCDGKCDGFSRKCDGKLNLFWEMPCV